MNQLFVIGNGFDLSHGLSTSFLHFHNWYWENYNLLGHENDGLTFLESGTFLVPSENYLKMPKKTVQDVNAILQIDHPFNIVRRKVRIINRLYSKFCEDCHNLSWGDIEGTYYDMLKTIINATATKSDKIKNVITLNDELKVFTNHFTLYLKSIVKDEISRKLSSPFALNINVKNSFQGVIPNVGANSDLIFEDEIYLEKSLLFDKQSFVTINNKNYYKIKGRKFLNFNYTPVLNYYNLPNEDIIKIHGTINNELDNPLLGFGDETDTFYNVIEDLNSHDALRFIKSMHYAKNGNYRRLLNFLEGGPFQVCILGHSCSLSDRTLLSSIFQHDYCVSIKVYTCKYKEENKFGEKDNFDETFRNISRHFDDKNKLRARVTNKDHCQPYCEKE